MSHQISTLLFYHKIFANIFQLILAKRTFFWVYIIVVVILILIKNCLNKYDNIMKSQCFF